MITLTRKHKQRLAIVLLIILGIGITTALALTAFRENMQFFFSPSQVVAGEAPKDKVIRVGGLVMKGSLQRASDSLTVKFVVTDMAQNVTIQYTGILPDLFREGQGIIATGKLQADGGFIANEVLAKHDENYMPPEVNQALKDAKVKK
jgi:cytochrome c-type biogenesis protein CcmE